MKTLKLLTGNKHKLQFKLNLICDIFFKKNMKMLAHTKITKIKLK